jgi:hypothetical protein
MRKRFRKDWGDAVKDADLKDDIDKQLRGLRAASGYDSQEESMIELPPLPASAIELNGNSGYQANYFDGIQMRAYGEACARAAIEAAAGICDRFAEREMHPAECAGAIRRMAARP